MFTVHELVIRPMGSKHTRLYYAECACGWTSRPSLTKTIAEERWAIHMKEVFPAPEWGKVPWKGTRFNGEFLAVTEDLVTVGG